MEELIKNIKDLPLSRRETSILTGISKDRIDNWILGKSKPNAQDIMVLTIFFKSIDGKNEKELKLMVAEREFSTQKNDKKGKNTPSDIDKSLLNLQLPNNDQNMTNELIRMLAEAIKANYLLAETNSILTRNAQTDSSESEEKRPKEQAS